MQLQLQGMSFHMECCGDLWVLYHLIFTFNTVVAAAHLSITYSVALHVARSGKVRSLSARLKIPTGAAARIVEPGSVEWLELQRGAAYTPSSGSPAALGSGAAAAALAGVITGGGGMQEQRSTSVDEATVGMETTTAKDSASTAAKARCESPLRLVCAVNHVLFCTCCCF